MKYLTPAGTDIFPDYLSHKTDVVRVTKPGKYLTPHERGLIWEQDLYCW